MVGLQWGDEGKGKLVDYLAGGFDAVARFNGGSNAGHTVVIGDSRRTFHLVPSGAVSGKELLIGAGVAVDPVVLSDELSMLQEGARSKLLVDGRCTLVTPADKELDAKIEQVRGGSAIGTTMRGVGPSFAMRAFRLSPTVSGLLAGTDLGPLVRFYEELSLDTSGLAAWAGRSRDLLRGLAGDVSQRVAEVTESGGSVLFEGSQGILLDLLHGSYPYVTSTHTTSSYIPASLGVSPSMAGEPLGVMKCYTTRVGSGPFPSEIGGAPGDRLRSLGKEYGSTTGRPRRVGWLDLVSLRYAVKLNGIKEVAVTKVDVLARTKDVKVCTAYKIRGALVTDFHSAMASLGEAEPVLESPFSLEGQDFDGGLPPGVKRLVAFVEERLGVRVRFVSHGEERSKTVEL